MSDREHARAFLCRWVAHHYLQRIPGQFVTEMPVGDVENCVLAAMKEVRLAKAKVLAEALQCAEYALLNPDSDRDFALRAIQSALGELGGAA